MFPVQTTASRDGPSSHMLPFSEVCLVKKATPAYELLLIQTSRLKRSLWSDGKTHECWFLTASPLPD